MEARPAEGYLSHSLLSSTVWDVDSEEFESPSCSLAGQVSSSSLNSSLERSSCPHGRPLFQPSGVSTITAKVIGSNTFPTASSKKNPATLFSRRVQHDVAPRLYSFAKGKRRRNTHASAAIRSSRIDGLIKHAGHRMLAQSLARCWLPNQLVTMTAPSATAKTSTKHICEVEGGPGGSMWLPWKRDLHRQTTASENGPVTPGTSNSGTKFKPTNKNHKRSLGAYNSNVFFDNAVPSNTSYQYQSSHHHIPFSDMSAVSTATALNKTWLSSKHYQSTNNDGLPDIFTPLLTPPTLHVGISTGGIDVGIGNTVNASAPTAVSNELGDELLSPTKLTTLDVTSLLPAAFADKLDMRNGLLAGLPVDRQTAKVLRALAQAGTNPWLAALPPCLLAQLPPPHTPAPPPPHSPPPLLTGGGSVTGDGNNTEVAVVAGATNAPESGSIDVKSRQRSLSSRLARQPHQPLPDLTGDIWGAVSIDQQTLASWNKGDNSRDGAKGSRTNGRSSATCFSDSPDSASSTSSRSSSSPSPIIGATTTTSDATIGSTVLMSNGRTTQSQRKQSFLLDSRCRVYAVDRARYSQSVTKAYDSLKGDNLQNGSITSLNGLPVTLDLSKIIKIQAEAMERPENESTRLDEVSEERKYTHEFLSNGINCEKMSKECSRSTLANRLPAVDSVAGETKQSAISASRYNANSIVTAAAANRLVSNGATTRLSNSPLTASGSNAPAVADRKLSDHTQRWCPDALRRFGCHFKNITEQKEFQECLKCADLFQPQLSHADL